MPMVAANCSTDTPTDKSFSSFSLIRLTIGTSFLEKSVTERTKETMPIKVFFLSPIPVFKLSKRTSNFWLSIFEEGADGRWERYDEYQRERCYSLRIVKKLLAEVGFALCALSADFDGGEADDNTERWYFTARAIKS